MAQSLTIVEEDGSLGSGEDKAAVAELTHTQGLLDAADEDVQYQFRSGEGIERVSMSLKPVRYPWVRVIHFFFLFS